MEQHALRPHLEAKYAYSAGDRHLLIASLAVHCVPDLRYPEGQVNSLYYDTPGRTLLAEKVNSDYIKTKVRLRWYGAVEAGRKQMIPAYVEIKSKEGTLRNKRRKRVDVSARLLVEGEESLGELQDFVRHAYELGCPVRGPLFPMIVIRYTRMRFIEPRSGARLSLDSDIRFSCVNQQFYPPVPALTLPGGVLEVKSRTGKLPEGLSVIRNLIRKKDSFSKYEECWQVHADPRYQREFRWMYYER
ncbi:MAG: VTC domain-containing protein [Chloroflexi bacterium]|nr:VTC domain-containing protein [Chloroflexota bacterium]